MSMLSVNLNSNPNPIEAAQIITATNIMFLRIVSITVYKTEKAFSNAYMKDRNLPSIASYEQFAFEHKSACLLFLWKLVSQQGFHSSFLQST